MREAKRGGWSGGGSEGKGGTWACSVKWKGFKGQREGGRKEKGERGG